MRQPTSHKVAHLVNAYEAVRRIEEDPTGLLNEGSGIEI